MKWRELKTPESTKSSTSYEMSNLIVSSFPVPQESGNTPERVSSTISSGKSLRSPTSFRSISKNNNGSSNTYIPKD